MSKKAEKILNQIAERVATWSEDDLEMLDNASRQIEEWRSGEYHATEEELRVLDAALADMDRGVFASEEAVQAAFAKFRSHEG